MQTAGVDSRPHQRRQRVVRTRRQYNQWVADQTLEDYALRSGFGYLGSTLTSAIYASFTFILFAIEASILSVALKLCLGVPLPIGHLISSLIVIPVAAYGVRRISWLQTWSQPIWLILQLAPIAFIVLQWREGVDFRPLLGRTPEASWLVAGAGAAVILSLLPQIGEQVDYLRFLPVKTKANRFAWWTALLVAGPGWIGMGGVKILLGATLAGLAVAGGSSLAQAGEPAHMYQTVFAKLVGDPVPALILTGVFVAVCQIKINVTNAYAGSIAASNFFSRLTHRHPGRVVWLVFNVLVALQLMEIGILGVADRILTVYSNFAVAWIGAVTADLLVNKPLGLSPKGIEFRRAYLPDLNPVGVGAMLASLLISTLSLIGVFGVVAQAFSPFIGLATAFVAAPVIAGVRGGRGYLARTVDELGTAPLTCVVCENAFEPQDMAACPVYQGHICSLCCTLEARCHDACKDGGGLVSQAAGLLRRLSPSELDPTAYRRIARFIGLLSLFALAIATVLALIYLRQTDHGAAAASAIRETLWLAFGGLTLLSAFAAWFFVLVGESQQAAEGESERQTVMLMDEIEAHGRTDAELQRAKAAAEAANLAKSRYIVGVSHEIRAPLNAISGYAQLLERNPEHNARDAARVIRRSATHMADLVNGLLDISRIENGTLRVDRGRVHLIELLDQLVDMFRLQAVAKGITFRHERPDYLPTWVFTDEKRLRQILINLLSNAIKYTQAGEAVLKVRWRAQVAEFEIVDTGVGIADADLERIFEPFHRVPSDATATTPGIGLGLTITKLLATVLGGEVTVESRPGGGSTFRVRLMLSEASPPQTLHGLDRRIDGYEGAARRILVTDDDTTHLDLVREILHPVGFDLTFAADGATALQAAERQPPDLVIMDISMPGMTGWEAAAQIRRTLGEDVAILMVSANAQDFSRGRREDDPHDDFLIKPYDVEDLLARIQTLLNLTWSYEASSEAFQ